MKKGNRKHIRLLAMAMSLAVVGMLAAFIALAAQPGPVAAQGLCDGPLAPLLPQCEDSTTTPGTTPTPPTDVTPGTDLPAGTMLDSSSTSAALSVKLTLTIVDLPNNLNSGSWVEIYLEDDYQEPGSISRQDVVFIATNGQRARGAVPPTTAAP